jgi:hypothetical protein
MVQAHVPPEGDRANCEPTRFVENVARRLTSWAGRHRSARSIYVRAICVNPRQIVIRGDLRNPR